tara:strand:+ start:1561 stop:1887 length:327 start_codon:yes stop_codon:yes gene_type:complete
MARLPGTKAMTSDHDIAAEIAAMRQEMAALRAERAQRVEENEATPSASSEEAEAAGALPAEIAETLEQITDAIKNYTEDAETEIADHPVAFLAGSFMLGMVVGLLLRR